MRGCRYFFLALTEWDMSKVSDTWPTPLGGGGGEGLFCAASVASSATTASTGGGGAPKADHNKGKRDGGK